MAQWSDSYKSSVGKPGAKNRRDVTGNPNPFNPYGPRAYGPPASSSFVRDVSGGLNPFNPYGPRAYGPSVPVTRPTTAPRSSSTPGTQAPAPNPPSWGPGPGGPGGPGGPAAAGPYA